MKLINFGEILKRRGRDALADVACYSATDIRPFAIAVVRRYPQRSGDRSNGLPLKALLHDDRMLVARTPRLTRREVGVSASIRAVADELMDSSEHGATVRLAVATCCRICEQALH